MRLQWNYAMKRKNISIPKQCEYHFQHSNSPKSIRLQIDLSLWIEAYSCFRCCCILLLVVSFTCFHAWLQLKWYLYKFENYHTTSENTFEFSTFALLWEINFVFVFNQNQPWVRAVSFWPKQCFAHRRQLFLSKAHTNELTKLNRSKLSNQKNKPI